MKTERMKGERITMRQKSRNWTARFGAALILALVACSVTFAQDVRTNYMPGTDFSKYHTYVWVNEVQGVPAVVGHPDQILDAQVKEAIDSQMVAKGFTKVEDGSKADLLLGYQLAIDQEKSIRRSRSTASGTTWAAGVAGAAWAPGTKKFGARHGTGLTLDTFQPRSDEAQVLAANPVTGAHG